MPIITYRNDNFVCETGETVLDCLLRHKQEAPSSCRSGVCQSCLMQNLNGTPPSNTSQNGIKDTFQAQGYFLPCVCIPTGDMEICQPNRDAVGKTIAKILSKTMLNNDVLRLTLQCADVFNFRAGQFISVHRPDGLIRSYSIANRNNSSGILELHVRRLPGGQMSGWIHDVLIDGSRVELTGPSGNCFYIPSDIDGGLLLIGTGTGLAPLAGIVNDALMHGHNGPIRLYHGSWQPEGLYLIEELQKLAAKHTNFEYVPCVDQNALDFMKAGRADQIAFRENANLKSWRVFLCGHPEMVKSARKQAFLLGASMSRIYADPFVVSKPFDSNIMI